jgi:hypothetical protein
VTINGTVEIEVDWTHQEVTNVWFSGAVDDIYDFDCDDKGINVPFIGEIGPARAAEVQAGYDTLGPGGGVFLHRLNYYNTTDRIWLQTPADQPGPPAQQFTYLGPDETFEGTPSAGVALSVGSTRVDWTWNPEIGKFDRSQNGSLHVDKANGQISSTNVIIMGVEYQPSVVDRNSPEAQTVGDGPAYVWSNGQYIEGTWKREVGIYPLQFFDLEGNEIALTPGNTWIELAKEVPTLDPSKTGVDMIIKPAA